MELLSDTVGQFSSQNRRDLKGNLWEKSSNGMASQHSAISANKTASFISVGYTRVRCTIKIFWYAWHVSSFYVYIHIIISLADKNATKFFINVVSFNEEFNKRRLLKKGLIMGISISTYFLHILQRVEWDTWHVSIIICLIIILSLCKHVHRQIKSGKIGGVPFSSTQCAWTRYIFFVR